MKKLLIYTLTLAAVATGLSSCKNEEEMIFDSSAAERLDLAKSEYAQILCEDGGKWVMEYFAREEEPGYAYVMTFSPNGSVTICGNNEWIGKGTQSATSLWGVISDNGVVLSFNTYNPLFHVFADPNNFSDGSGIDYTGSGHSGDYEFVILSVNPEHTLLTLKGKKHSMPIIMRKLDSSVDDKEYMDAVANARDNLFSSTINSVILTYAPTGERFVVEDGAWGILSVYPEAGDAITQTESANVIITADRMRFMRPFQVSTAANPNDSITIQSFLIQPDGSLLADDDFARGSTIMAPALGTIFSDIRYSWMVDDKKCGGAYATLLDDFKNALKANKGTFKSVVFGYDSTLLSSKITVNSTVKSGPSQKAQVSTYRVEYVADGDKVTIKYVGCDATSQKMLDDYPSLKALLESIDNATFTLSSTNKLAPNSLVMANGEDTLTVNAQ